MKDPKLQPRPEDQEVEKATVFVSTELQRARACEAAAKLERDEADARCVNVLRAIPSLKGYEYGEFCAAIRRADDAETELAKLKVENERLVKANKEAETEFLREMEARKQAELVAGSMTGEQLCYIKAKAGRAAIRTDSRSLPFLDDLAARNGVKPSSLGAGELDLVIGLRDEHDRLVREQSADNKEVEALHEEIGSLKEQLKMATRKFRCCGGNDEKPKDHCTDCPEYELKEDAERWRKLIGCGRVRRIGSARLGKPDAHLGIELWGRYPDISGLGIDASNWAKLNLIEFVDGLKLKEAGKGKK